MSERWTIHICEDCRELGHGPGSRCRTDRRRTWTRMATLEVVGLADVINVLNLAYHPQHGENPAHPVDVIHEHFGYLSDA